MGTRELGAVGWQRPWEERQAQRGCHVRPGCLEDPTGPLRHWGGPGSMLLTACHFGERGKDRWRKP